jgi:hypothetical protein
MKIIVTCILLFISVFNCSFCDEAILKSKPLEILKKSALKGIVPTKAELSQTQRQLSATFLRPKRKAVITPAYCDLVYVNGSEILYSYYDHTFSVTILSGYDYGLQAFYDYYGNLIDGTSRWSYATVNGELMMRHRYLDSKVYTNYDGQMIIFD